MKLLLFFCLFSLAAFAVEEEESEALSAMRLSCEKQKVGLGCYNYANMLVRSEKAEAAEKYFEMGCKLSHQPSCAKEKWDLPERKVTPEIVELPASTPTEIEESPVESPDYSGGPTILPSRVTVNSSAPASEESAPSSEISGDPSNETYKPSITLPTPAPAAEAKAPAQSDVSSEPAEDLNSETPAEGAEAEPSVTE